MQKTRIEILGLQNKAIELRTVNKLSYRQIAKELTEFSGEKITFDIVRRFFALKEHDAVEVAAKSDKLKAKLVEGEINTIQGCVDCIDELKDICKKCKDEGDYRGAIQAIDKIYPALDMLNKVLGKYQNLPAPNVNFFVNQTPNTPQIKDAAGVLCQAIREAQDAEFTEA